MCLGVVVGGGGVGDAAVFACAPNTVLLYLKALKSKSCQAATH